MSPDMTREQFNQIIDRIGAVEKHLTERIDKIDNRMDKMDIKVSALPDKAEIYRATFLLHGAVWAAIATTIGLSIAFASAAHMLR